MLFQKASAKIIILMGIKLEKIRKDNKKETSKQECWNTMTGSTSSIQYGRIKSAILPKTSNSLQTLKKAKR